MRIRPWLVRAVACLAAVVPASDPRYPTAPPQVRAWRVDLADSHTEQDNIVHTREGIQLAQLDRDDLTSNLDRGYGFYVGPVVQLDQSISRLRGVLSAERPAGTTVQTEMRGLDESGRWTEWRQAHTASGEVDLPRPSQAVQVRITLHGTHGRSPRITALRLVPDIAEGTAPPKGAPLVAGRAAPPKGAPLVAGRAASPWGTPFVAGPMALPQETPFSKRLFATRVGMVGHTTANGHKIRERDHFVALPSRRALNPTNQSRDYQVKVCYPRTGRCEIAPVWDVGPWNVKDDYWNPPGVREMWPDLPQGRPQAQAAYRAGHNDGKDDRGRVVRNPAGIDLGDGTFLDGLAMTANDWVEVTFLWTDTDDQG